LNFIYTGSNAKLELVDKLVNDIKKGIKELKKNPDNPKYISGNASIYGVSVKLPDGIMGDVLKFFNEIINDLPDKKEN